MFQPAELAFLAAGALAGGFVSGLAGFGTTMFALGFWLQILPPAQAVALSVAHATFTGLQGLLAVRGAILDQPRRLARLLVPALVGVPFGLAALSLIEPRGLKLTLAAVMLLYGAFFLTRGSLPQVRREAPAADMAVGLAGGFMGGLAGLSGVLPAMWCALWPWPRDRVRAVLQPYNVTMLATVAALHALRGTYDTRLMLALAVSLPLGLVAAQGGLAVFRRLGDAAFQRLLIALMTVSGLVLLLRELP